MGTVNILAAYGASGQRWDVAKTSADLAIGGIASNTLTKTAGVGWRSSLALLPVSGVATFTNVATWTTSGNPGAGNASADLNSYLGLDANSIGLSMVDGEVYYGGGSIGNVGWTYTTGDSVTTEIDRPNDRIRWNKNGGAFSSWFSSVGMTGSIYPGTGQFTNGDTVTTTF